MSALSLSVAQLLWGLLLVGALAFLGGVLLAATRDALEWNRRRAARARAYRARMAPVWAAQREQRRLEYLGVDRG